MAQQQGGGGGGGGGNDSGYGTIWLVVILFALGYLIWKFAKGYIIKVIFYINIFQAKIISLFTPALDHSIFLMETVRPGSVTFEQLVQVTTYVGEYSRYPVMAILMGLAAYLYFSNVTLKFRKTYSMPTLRNQEKANWQQIIPVAKLDIAKESIDKGPWAMAQTPMEFAKRHNLLRKDEFAPDDPLKPGTPVTAGIRRGESKSVFTLQLGAVWEGFEVLPIHYLALASVFAARINQDRDGASKLLTTINKSTDTGKISFMGAKALMKKHIDFPVVRECEQRHAYNITVLATLVEAARDDGVLPCCDFLWLKKYDRRLWYMLSSVGRQTPFTEVGGVFAHWKAEKALGRRSIVPMVDEAVKALESAVKEVKLSLKEMGELKP